MIIVFIAMTAVIKQCYADGTLLKDMSDPERLLRTHFSLACACFGVVRNFCVRTFTIHSRIK